MTNRTSKIIWTQIDEAPALATYSLLPIVQAFTRGTGVEVETRDISLAGRIIASFPENLTEGQRIPDHLARLGELTLAPEANIIKLPNISASIPQLKEAIKELQEKGYRVPDYPESPRDEAEKAIQARYAKVLGSAVNPVLREGNSDRRSPLSVKQFSKKNPHKLGAWSPESRSHVAHMSGGDFYGSESSLTLAKATDYRIEFVAADGGVTVLKKKAPLLAGEIIDTAVMSARALRKFYEDQIEDARKSGLLLSLHLKATMMKVSDPVMFGHAVTVFYRDVFEKHAAVLKELGVNPNNGLGDLHAKIQGLPAEKKAEIEGDIKAVYAKRPALAMVDSDKGITNLHVPNDIIVDASMPVVVRESGKMWGPDGKLHDTKAMIP
ncbi:MAG TPA: NADP-dependent isocitrate dehydrogenase, partial [Anaeromyxobacter sp.]